MLSCDPRAIRTRQAFQQAFKELLQTRPYHKITVTDISEKYSNILYINDGTIAVTSALTGGKPLSTPLPKVHLKDIGKKSGGASPEEVARQVLSSLTSGVGSAVGKLDLSKLQDVGAALKEQTGGATDKVKEGLGGAGDKLKGLFQ